MTVRQLLLVDNDREFATLVESTLGPFGFAITVASQLRSSRTLPF